MSQTDWIWSVVQVHSAKYCTATTQLCVDSHPCALYCRFTMTGAALSPFFFGVSSQLAVGQGC